MSSPIFHRFPKLPYELRLLIWEASCFNGNSTTRHGLNYVHLIGKSPYMSALQYRPAAESETSACLVDTGLWQACVESRAVMIRCLRKRGLLLPDGPPCCNEARWLKAPVQTPIIVSGCQDLFCFRLSDWWKAWNLSSSFFFFLHPVNFLNTTNGLSQRYVHNLAFELDGNWGRHVLIWLALQVALRTVELLPFSGKISMSIIDRDVQWYRDDSTYDITYADYDNEYTIVRWDSLCYCDQSGVGTGAHALRKLIWPLFDDGTPMFNHQSSFDFYNWLETRVKVLVRRDNEVTCPSLRTGRRIYRPDNHEFDSSWVRPKFMFSLSNRVAEESEESDGTEEEDSDDGDEAEEGNEEEEDTESEEDTDDEEPGEDEAKRNEELESLPVFSFRTQDTTRLWYFPYRK